MTRELLPTGMVYPIYRAEHKEQFEQLLRQTAAMLTIPSFFPLTRTR